MLPAMENGERSVLKWFADVNVVIEKNGSEKGSNK
jgi:hypothetical protein